MTIKNGSATINAVTRRYAALYSLLFVSTGRLCVGGTWEGAYSVDTVNGTVAFFVAVAVAAVAAVGVPCCCCAAAGVEVTVAVAAGAAFFFDAAETVVVGMAAAFFVFVLGDAADGCVLFDAVARPATELLVVEAPVALFFAAALGVGVFATVLVAVAVAMVFLLAVAAGALVVAGRALVDFVAAYRTRLARW